MEEDCDRLEKYPVSVLPNFLKTADFPLFKLSIHSKRISTVKIPGKFFSGSLEQDCRGECCMFLSEAAESPHNTMAAINVPGPR